jgi:hypothetical protein
MMEDGIFCEEMALMLAFGSKYKPNCEKGSALLLVIILMVVFSLLSVSMLILLTTSTQISGNYRRDLKTLYIADAGMEHAISILRQDPDPAYWAANDPGEVTFGDGKYEMDATLLSPEYPDPSPSIQGLYKIVSTGAIGGFKRAVEVYVKFVPISGGASGYAAVTMSWQTIPPPAS